jgi:hypothetical protein
LAFAKLNSVRSSSDSRAWEPLKPDELIGVEIGERLDATRRRGVGRGRQRAAVVDRAA